MLRIEKKTHLKDTPEYEGYTENIAKLTKKEQSELGIRQCNCKCKNKNKEK